MPSLWEDGDRGVVLSHPRWDRELHRVNGVGRHPAVFYRGTGGGDHLKRSSGVLDMRIGETDISFSWDNLCPEPDDRRSCLKPVFLCSRIEADIRDAPPSLPELSSTQTNTRGTEILPFTGTVLLHGGSPENTGNDTLKDLFNVRPRAMNGDTCSPMPRIQLSEAREAEALSSGGCQQIAAHYLVLPAC